MDRNSSFYILKANKESNNPLYINEISDYSTNLEKKYLPTVFDYIHYAIITQTSLKYLYSIVRREYDFYRIFYIRKRNGGKRRIVVPEERLHQLQNWIKKNVLERLQVHPAAQAYYKDSSILKNASLHTNKKYIIKIDLDNFFESISERRVYHVFRSAGYLPSVSFLFTRICTYPLSIRKKYRSKKWLASKKYYLRSKMTNEAGKNIVGSLLQGTSTSPHLSNLCFYRIDELITKLCKDYKFQYSRYSDDITMSSNFTTKEDCICLLREVTCLLNKQGFRLNKKKTRICLPGSKKIVTGLIVNSDKPLVPQDTYLKVKNYIYYAQKFGPSNVCSYLNFHSVIGFKNHLFGLIYYVKSINEAKGLIMLEKANRISWPEI